MRNTTSTKSSRSVGRRLRTVVAGLALCGAVIPATLVATSAVAGAETQVIGGPGSLAQPGITNLSHTGYAGSRQMLPHQYCTQWAGAAMGTLQWATFMVSPAAAYGSYKQSISMQVRLDRWNGSSWAVVMWHPSPQTISALPGQYARFAVRAFNVPAGYSYRLVHAFTWSVNGQVVGRTYDTVNGDAIARGGTGGYVASNPGAAQGFCTFYR